MSNSLPKPQEFTAVFEDKQVYNDKFTHLHFELKQPHRLNFRAGQFLSLLVDDDGTRRAYSIASDPDIDHGVEILLDTTPQGKGVKYLQTLEFGDEVRFLAPMGRFVIEQDETAAVEEKSLALVGTGSGVAPLRSMLLDQLKNKQDQRPITLYWGLRYAHQMIWQDDFSRWSQQYPNFKFHPVLSRPEEGWPLCQGRVTDCLSVHQLTPQTGYYLCGGKMMIDDVKQVLQERGVEPGSIHHEKFF